MTDNRERIEQFTQILRKLPTSREKEILQCCEFLYTLLYAEIHKVLAPEKTDESEEQIRAYIRDIIKLELPISQRQYEKFDALLPQYKKLGVKENIDKCYEYRDRWAKLYDNFYALVAFRSLRHYCEYLEGNKRDKDKVWKYSIDPQGDGGFTGVNFPFFYYFNQMVLKKDIKFISKQQATGTGKSYSNTMAITWLLGIDADNDCLVVLGNPALVLTNTKGIVDTMITDRYAKVFPEFQRYHDTDDDGIVRNKIFSVCRQKEGELTVAHSNKTMNVKIISKDTPVDGIRVRYLFLDDVCRSKDAGNNKQHEIDISNY